MLSVWKHTRRLLLRIVRSARRVCPQAIGRCASDPGVYFDRLLVNAVILGNFYPYEEGKKKVHPECNEAYIAAAK